jgi:hypothetical protein
MLKDSIDALCKLAIIGIISTIAIIGFGIYELIRFIL